MFLPWSASISIPPLTASIFIAASLVPWTLLITIVSTVPTLVDSLIAFSSSVFEDINTWPPDILMSFPTSASMSIPPLVASILIAASAIPLILLINYNIKGICFNYVYSNKYVS